MPRPSARVQQAARIAAGTLAGLGALAGAWVGWVELLEHPLVDAGIYYEAAARLNAGEPLYPTNVDPTRPYLYPPLFAVLLRPVALLGYPAFALVWEGVVVVSLVLLLARLGVRRARTWLAVGWLGVPIAWALTAAQAHIPLTLLVAIGHPWSIAMAANIKLFPILVACWWLGRRDFASLRRLALWIGVLGALQLILEPSGTLSFFASVGLGQVGDVRNFSPYVVSPIVWGALLVLGVVAAVALARTRYGWPAAVALATLSPPRLFAYMLTGLLAAFREPAARGESSHERASGAPVGAQGGEGEGEGDRDQDRARPPLTLVLPAYNERDRIGPALDELFGYLRRAGPARQGGRAAGEMGPVEVLVVDDGSEDETAAIVEARPEASATEGPARLRVLRAPHTGKGGAVRAGVLAANSDYILFADADLATPPDQLPFLTEALATHDIALGSRVHPDGSDRRASQPLHRRLLGRLFHALAAFWVTGPVPDTQCGFKGFRRDAAHDLFRRQRIGSIVFDAEIIHLARRRGYSMAIVPVQWSDKRGSRMRVRPLLALRVLLDLVRIPLMHRGVRRR